MSETNSLNSLEHTTDETRSALDAQAIAPDAAGHRLFERLGVGGMGEVYRCDDDALGRDLALKVLRRELHGDADAEERFLREARLTGSLQHPGVVPIHQLSRLADGRPCYTMKLVRGRTFADILREEPIGAERLPRLLAVVEKVCQTVAFAHSKGVIHRDLKPSNVMVGEFGEVQVVDWGLAKELCRDEMAPPPNEATGNEETLVRREEEEAGLSRAGLALGTPAYMPPEQAAGDWDIVDERADVFALGAMLCVLLTGQPPYQGGNREEVLRRARRGGLAEALGRLERCGAEAALVQLCRECLSVEREGRPRNASVVAERVAAYQADVQERLRRAEVERAEAQVKAREERKRRRLLAALALAAAVLLAGGAMVWRQGQRRQAEADGTVATALGAARLLRDQARSDPLTAAGYDKAMSAARNAVEMARAGGASATVQCQADDLLDEVKGEAAEADKDRQLLARLLEARIPREVPKYRRDDRGMMLVLAEPTAEERFASAFRAWGLDVDALPASEAAARLKGRPAAVVTELIAALDEWASERRQAKPKAAERVAELAAALDAEPDSLRRELRAILARGRLPLERALGMLSAALRPLPLSVELPWGPDRMRLRQLAARVDPASEPVLGLLALTRALRLAGEEALAERLLRRAIGARPREVVLYHTLGQLLQEQQPPRWKESVGFYRVAWSLRPDLGVTLAEALRRSGQDDEALDLLAAMVKEKPDNPYLHLQQGAALRAKGNLNGAIASYQTALKLDPVYAQGYNSLGSLLCDDQRDYANALVAFQKAISLDPTLAHAHHNLGVVLAAKGDRDGAIACYKKTLELDPKHVAGHTNLGNALYGKHDLNGAIACYQKAIELNPKSVLAHNNLGVALRAKGDLNGAIASCHNALALDPKYVPAHNNLGVALAEKHDLNGAIACYQKAIELDPKDAEPRFNLGRALAEKHDLDGAIACYQKAIELDPKDAAIHSTLGVALRAKGDLNGAIASWHKALALDPKYAPAHNNLGLALADRHDWDGAIACYKKAIELDPKRASTHYNLGLALTNKRDLDGAIACYKKALELDPKHVPTHYNLGVSLRDKGDRDGAIARFKKVLELDPKHVLSLYNLGIDLGAKGDLNGAIACYKKAIELDPKYAAAHNNLGNVLEAKHDLDGAIACYQKAATLDPKDATAPYNLGNALAAKDDLNGALACYQNAIKRNRNLAEAYCNLAHVLRRQGRFAEAVVYLRRGHELGSKRPKWNYPSAQWLRDAERGAALARKLPAVLTGEAAPANLGETVAFARMCQQPYQKRYAAAARFYADAFAIEPKLAADLQNQHRYNAACSAVLAAAGQGEDAQLLPDKVAAMFRRWALSWLRDDLAAYAKLAERDNPQTKQVIRQRFLHWRSDADLAAVRDPSALGRLDEPERAAWQAMWYDVEELAKRVAKKDAAKK